MSAERGMCAKCGREISTYVPAGGDGSVVYVVVHNYATGFRCSGSRTQPYLATPPH